MQLCICETNVIYVHIYILVRLTIQLKV